MPVYKYYTCEPLVNGALVCELPLYGVHMDRSLNNAGNFTGTFRLGTGVYDDSILLDGTRPGRYALICKRDDVPIWGGILWSRTFNTDANTIQITGQTFESVFAHIPMRFNFQTNDQDEDLWVTLWNNIQAVPDAIYNFGFNMNIPSNTGIIRGVDYLAAEHRMVQEAIDQLIGYNDGYAYTINLTAGDNDKVVKTIQLRFNRSLATDNDSGITLDFPGSIRKYWWSENASQGAIKQIGRAGNLAPGASMPYASFSDTNKINDGYIQWTNVDMYSDLLSDSDLTNRTQGDYNKGLIPVTEGIVELAPSANFSGWNNIGNYVTMRMYPPDARWPSEQNDFGYKLEEKILEGWSLTPESSGQEEMIRLSLGGP